MKILESMKCIFDKIKCIIIGDDMMERDEYIVKYPEKEKSDIYALLYHFFVKHFHHTLGDNTDISDKEVANYEEVKLDYEIKLMKLMVIVHSIYLYYQRKPLLQDIQAWEHGTVSNVMWAKMKHQFILNENKEIYDDILENVDELLKEYDPFVYDLAKSVNEYYGKLSKTTLVNLAHKKNSWIEKDIENLTKSNLHAPIEDEKIISDFSKFLPEDRNKLFEYLSDFNEDTTIAVMGKTLVVEEFEENEVKKFLGDNLVDIRETTKDIVFIGFDEEGYYFYD